jgi:hypothetical protein
MAAGWLGASLMRHPAVHPRSPARVPCIPRTPWQSRTVCAMSMHHASAAAVAALATLPMSNGRGARMTPANHNTEAGGQGRGQGAADRRRRRGERPGLAAVGVRGGWQRSGAIGRRWGAARRDVARSDGGPAWSLWRKRGVAWQCMRTLGATAAARDGQSVRRQCCCDGSAEGGAVRCAVARSAACDA